MRPLTPRQGQIFDLIKEKIAETGMPPTRAEIADFFGFKSANEYWSVRCRRDCNPIGNHLGRKAYH